LFVFWLLWLKNGYFAANLQTSSSISLLSVFFPVPKKSENLRRGRRNLSEALCKMFYVFSILPPLLILVNKMFSLFSNLPLFENHLQNSPIPLNRPLLCTPKFFEKLTAAGGDFFYIFSDYSLSFYFFLLKILIL
jgi:hypothetical protein